MGIAGFQTKLYLWGVFRSKQQRREATCLTEEVTSGREKGITRSTCNTQNPIRPLSHSGIYSFDSLRFSTALAR